jgi:tetratricopeptide (TPR) repeat protein
MDQSNFPQLIERYSSQVWNIKYLFYHPDFTSSDLDQFSQYCTTKSDSPFSPIIAGFLTLGFRKVTEAQKIFDQIVKQDPENESGILGLATVNAIQNHLDDALPLFEKVLSLNIHHVGAMVGLAAVHKRKKHYHQAEKLLNAALKEDAADISARLELATLNAILKNENQAILILRSIVHDGNGMAYFTPAWIDLARLLEQTGQVIEAEQAYSTALRLNPQDRILYSWMIAFFKKTGQNDKALQLEQSLNKQIP